MLLSTKIYCLLAFETKDALRAAGSAALQPQLGNVSLRAALKNVCDSANFWKAHTGVAVWPIPVDDVFLVLSPRKVDRTGTFMKILHGERVGWIRAEDFLCLTEVVSV